MHFSAFFPMMEAAEHALLRELGFSVVARQDDGSHLTWPRVSATCDYFSAARFEDLLTIDVSVQHLGTKSVRYRFLITCQGRHIADGRITAVCCRMTAGNLQSEPIPHRYRQAFQRYLVTEEAAGTDKPT